MILSQLKPILYHKFKIPARVDIQNYTNYEYHNGQSSDHLPPKQIVNKSFILFQNKTVSQPCAEDKPILQSQDSTPNKESY